MTTISRPARLGLAWLGLATAALGGAEPSSPPIPGNAAEKQRLKTLEAHLREYLHHEYPCEVTSVGATSTEIHVQGRIGAEQGSLSLAEVPLVANVTEGGFAEILPIAPTAEGAFSATVPRLLERGGRQVDRLFSRWAVIRKTDAAPVLLSHARSASTVPCRDEWPEWQPRGRKGLGGFHAGGPVADLHELGISAVTVNVLLSSFMRTEAGPGRTAFEHGGRAWFTDDRAIAGLDATLTEAAKHGLLVSAIILVPKPPANPDDTSYPRLVGHPDAVEGIFAMPNLTSEIGLGAYAAALEFLAARYSQKEAPHGRIHHWIMHNEVNSCWSWANAGDKPEMVYLDLLVKSLRLAQLVLRQHDPHGRVFVSLDQHWTASPGAHCFPGRRILEDICDFCAAEGDFPWALAHHPYPQDLGNPRVWEDTQATFSFDSPKITYKNLEVLAAWMGRPQALYLGKERRPIHLTEQGLNSRDYSENSLQEQAAGMAYAWNKMKRLPEIAMFDYHNWVDNRAEGGLRIGLHKFKDEPGDPLGRKPIWYVFQALETPGEEAATAFAKPIVGIQEWEEIMHREPIR